jgi:ribosomal-protein-alanine N-acetyltransferase
MIEKNISVDKIKDILNEYKENYNPIISEYTKIYIYTVDNKNVAFVIFDVIYERCEIIDIYTKEEYRRKNIAFNLINEIIKDFNIRNITLEVNINNKNAIKLYEKVGFKVASVRKGYYNGIDAFLMIKEVG